MTLDRYLKSTAISKYLGLCKTSVRFTRKIDKKHWKQIDNLIFKVLPKLWREYKKANRL